MGDDGFIEGLLPLAVTGIPSALGYNVVAIGGIFPLTEIKEVKGWLICLITNTNQSK
jgi:hypothetical protein